MNIERNNQVHLKKMKKLYESIEYKILKKINANIDKDIQQEDRHVSVINMMDQEKLKEKKIKIWKNNFTHINYYHGENFYDAFDTAGQDIIDFLILSVHGSSNFNGDFSKLTTDKNHHQLSFSQNGIESNQVAWKECSLELPFRSDALVAFNSCNLVPRPKHGIKGILNSFMNIKNGLGMKTGYIYANYTQGYYNNKGFLYYQLRNIPMESVENEFGQEKIKGYVFTFDETNWVIHERGFVAKNAAGLRSLKNTMKSDGFKASGQF